MQSDEGGVIQFHWGDPYEEPRGMTVGEYVKRYWRSLDEYAEAWGSKVDEINLDRVMDFDEYLTEWCRNDSSTARAYQLLEQYDLTQLSRGGDGAGEIRFVDGACPGNDTYLCVEAPTMLDVSLLQRRLNDLDARIWLRLV